MAQKRQAYCSLKLRHRMVYVQDCPDWDKPFMQQGAVLESTKMRKKAMSNLLQS
jgi:hypothetical protein